MATVERVASDSSAGRQAVIERGRVDAARQLAQLLQRVRELVARRGRELLGLLGVAPDVGADHPQLQRQRDEPLLGPVVQVALEPAALGVAGGDDPLARRLHLGQPSLGLGQQPLVLQRHRRRGTDRLDHLRVVVERRVVDDRGDLAAVALDRRRWLRSGVTGGTSTGRPAASA